VTAITVVSRSSRHASLGNWSAGSVRLTTSRPQAATMTTDPKANGTQKLQPEQTHKENRSWKYLAQHPVRFDSIRFGLFAINDISLSHNTAHYPA